MVFFPEFVGFPTAVVTQVPQRTHAFAFITKPENVHEVNESSVLTSTPGWIFFRDGAEDEKGSDLHTLVISFRRGDPEEMISIANQIAVGLRTQLSASRARTHESMRRAQGYPPPNTPGDIAWTTHSINHLPSTNDVEFAAERNIFGMFLDTKWDKHCIVFHKTPDSRMADIVSSILGRDRAYVAPSIQQVIDPRKNVVRSMMSHERILCMHQRLACTLSSALMLEARTRGRVRKMITPHLDSAEDIHAHCVREMSSALQRYATSDPSFVDVTWIHLSRACVVIGAALQKKERFCEMFRGEEALIRNAVLCGFKSCMSRRAIAEIVRIMRWSTKEINKIGCPYNLWNFVGLASKLATVGNITIKEHVSEKHLTNLQLEHFANFYYMDAVDREGSKTFVPAIATMVDRAFATHVAEGADDSIRKSTLAMSYIMLPRPPSGVHVMHHMAEVCNHHIMTAAIPVLASFGGTHLRRAYHLVRDIHVPLAIHEKHVAGIRAGKIIEAQLMFAMGMPSHAVSALLEVARSVIGYPQEENVKALQCCLSVSAELLMGFSTLSDAHRDNLVAACVVAIQCVREAPSPSAAKRSVDWQLAREVLTNMATAAKQPPHQLRPLFRLAKKRMYSKHVCGIVAAMEPPTIKHKTIVKGYTVSEDVYTYIASIIVFFQAFYGHPCETAAMWNKDDAIRAIVVAELASGALDPELDACVEFRKRCGGRVKLTPGGHAAGERCDDEDVVVSEEDVDMLCVEDLVMGEIHRSCAPHLAPCAC